MSRPIPIRLPGWVIPGDVDDQLSLSGAQGYDLRAFDMATALQI